MYTTNGSFLINNVDVGSYIIDIEYNYPKLWSNNTGRTLSGKMSGTLIGVFPKFVVQFKPLTKTELETLATILDSASQTITYYDPNKKQTKTITTYSSDWAVKCKNINQNESFSVSFIALNKRS